MAFGLAAAVLAGCRGSVERVNKDSLDAQKPEPPAVVEHPAPRVPAGVSLYADPQGGGRLLYRTRHGGPSFARTNMRAFLFSLKGYFDGPMTVMAATVDAQDTVVEALLSGMVAGQPVQGLATVVMGQGGATAGLIYDSAAGLHGSYDRLAGYFEQQVLRGNAEGSIRQTEKGLRAFGALNGAWGQAVRGAPGGSPPTLEAVMRACEAQNSGCREVPTGELLPQQ